MDRSMAEGQGASNRGMLYHEVQESKLCAGGFFSEFELAALASDLDRQMMLGVGVSVRSKLDRQMMLGSVTRYSFPEVSHNVSLDGDFSIQCQSHDEAKKIIEDGYNRDCIGVDEITKSFKETSLIQDSDTTTSILVTKLLIQNAKKIKEDQRE